VTHFLYDKVISMNEKLQRLLENIVPFLMLGIAIALIIGLFIMLSYVLIWGLLIGGILWAISFIKNYFFPRHQPAKTKGRVIEHTDKD
jgi:TRAP-type C4-dicarboxylate transport system permease small subunit